jgi:transposase
MTDGKVRVRRTIAEKRRIVELTLQRGQSVARVAQAEGVNSHQVFQWRRLYRQGELGESITSPAALLPVVISKSESHRERSEEVAASLEPAPASSCGVIHIELPGIAAISVEHGADLALLRAILESLRK